MRRPPLPLPAIPVPSSDIISVAFSPYSDHLLATGSADHTAALWDLRDLSQRCPRSSYGWAVLFAVRVVLPKQYFFAVFIFGFFIMDHNHHYNAILFLTLKSDFGLQRHYPCQPIFQVFYHVFRSYFSSVFAIPVHPVVAPLPGCTHSGPTPRTSKRCSSPPSMPTSWPPGPPGWSQGTSMAPRHQPLPQPHPSPEP